MTWAEQALEVSRFKQTKAEKFACVLCLRHARYCRTTLPVAVIHAPVPPRRTISECIALLPDDSTAAMDTDFVKDVEAAIESHRELLEPPAWD
jgi:hypothetical protein